MKQKTVAFLLTALASSFVVVLPGRAANITWTNSASGGWNTAANWLPSSVPGPNDTAIIAISGVTVSLNSATTVGGITLGTGGAGTATFSLNGQALGLNGPLAVIAGGAFTVDSGSLTGNTNALLSGTIGWSAGTLGGVLTMVSGSTLNITSTANHDMGNCTMTNNGTVAWANGTIRGGGNVTTIYNNGLWDAQSDQTFAGAGLGGAGTVFNNAGTFRKSGSTGGDTTFSSGGVFNNTGNLDSRTSYITLSYGGNFTGGTATNLTGFVYLSGGGFNINGTVTSTNVQLAGASLTGNNVINGGLNWIIGVWNNSAVTIANNTLLLITSANNHDMGNCAVTNNGTVAWANGTIRGGGNLTTIYNNGLWDAQSDQTFAGAGLGGAGTVFNNAGTFRKSGSTGGDTTFSSGGVFNNTGNLDSRTSYITLSYGGNFTGGTATNLTGFIYLSGGGFNINGTVTSTNVQLAGASLAGNNVINGGLNWIIGVWNNSAVTIANNTLLLITSANNHDIGNCAVTNNGTVAWANGTIRGGGNITTIYNNGLWDTQSDQTFAGAGLGGAGTVFNNYGALRKSGGASEFANATIFTSGTVINQLAGMIDVQNGTNGLELAFQGGGSFTGGYVTTNQFGLTVLSLGNFTLNGTVTGTNCWQDVGNLVGDNLIKGALTWVGGTWSGANVTIDTNATLKVAGAGNNDLPNCNMTNYGTVEWTTGILRGGASGTYIYNYGLWNAESDQTLNDGYAGGGVVFNNLGTFRKSAGASGNQTLFASAVLYNQASGLVDVQQGNFVLQGGGNFTGGYTTTNSTGITYLSSGNFNLNGTVTSSNVVENAGNLVGSNVINGGLAWVAGVWNNATITIASNSTVSVAGSGNNDLANCNLTNYGTVQWTSGTLRGGANPGTFVYNYGLWDVQSDQAFNSAYAGNGVVFNNLGTFRKSVGSSANQTLLGGGVLFNQLSGVLDVQHGYLTLQGSGNFTGGTAAGSLGAIYLSIGSFNINGTLTPGPGSFIENSGNLVGNNVINGGLAWVAGVWNNATVTIASNSTVSVAGSGNNDLANCNLTNYGTVQWTSGTLRGGANPGTFVYNYGLWDAQSDQAFNSAYAGNGVVFNNLGTFRKESTAGTTAMQSGVTFNNSGKLDAQDGNIALQGAYSLANGTRMGFGLGGSVGNGSISLSGAASFSGSASVNLNGYFWPAAGSTFNLLNYTSETGTLFTNLVLPALGYISWQTNYGATAFALSVVAHTATNTTPTNLFLGALNSSNFVVAWPGDHTGWRLQGQTNSLQVGLTTTWFDVPGSALTNQLVIPKINPTVFYRMVYP